MTRHARRLVAALTLAAGAVMLTGCSGDADAAAQPLPDCIPPLACGPMYPAVIYPWAATPYLGYLHDPAHVIILTSGPRTVVTYRPYPPPLRPAFRPSAPRYVPPAPGARPAPAKPAQRQPAPPAKPAPAKPAPAVRTTRK